MLLMRPGTCNNAPNKPPTHEQLLWVFHDGLKEPHERLRQVMVQVVLAVDGQVVSQRVYWVLRLLIRFRPLGCLDNDVRHAVPHSRSSGRIPLLHLLGQLHMSRLVLVLIGVLGQALQGRAATNGKVLCQPGETAVASAARSGQDSQKLAAFQRRRGFPGIQLPSNPFAFAHLADDQQGEVELVHEQVCNDGFYILASLPWRPLHQDLFQARSHYIAHLPEAVGQPCERRGTSNAAQR